MLIRPLVPPLKYAGDPPGPFAEGRPLRVLVDLAAEARIREPWFWNSVTVPDRDQMLWSLCQRDDIETYWLAQDGETGDGSVHFRDVDRGSDTLMYVTTRPEEQWMQGVSLYSQVELMAVSGGSRALEVLTKAALADDLRVDLVVTCDENLVELEGFYARRINAMTSTEALAIIGLYLRRQHESLPIVGPDKFQIDEHSLAWTAVRSQLPEGWAWGSALVDHDSVAGDDATLLFGSLFERLVRGLAQRDALHRAVFQPANNRTRMRMTEAFDYLMFNLVGAFDAAARSAHLGAGRPWDKRFNGKWQNKQWRRDLNVPQLDQMFSDGEPADDLFYVLRMLRNTVHGAGLGSLTSKGMGRDAEVLAILPRDDAAEISDRLQRVDPFVDWGIGRTLPFDTHFDAARMTEALLPRVLDTLNQIVGLCPLKSLQSTGRLLTTGPGDEIPFDLGTRARACLLYGLEVPGA